MANYKTMLATKRTIQEYKYNTLSIKVHLRYTLYTLQSINSYITCIIKMTQVIKVHNGLHTCDYKKVTSYLNKRLYYITIIHKDDG